MTDFDISPLTFQIASSKFYTLFLFPAGCSIPTQSHSYWFNYFNSTAWTV